MKTLLNYIKKIIKANSYSITLAEMKVEEFLKYAQTNDTLSKSELQMAKIISADMIDKITSIDKYDVDKAISIYNKRKNKKSNNLAISCGDGYLVDRCGNPITEKHSNGNCGSSSSSSCGSSSYSSGCGTTSGGRGC